MCPAPVITSVLTAAGPVGGGTTVSIVGTKLTHASVVGAPVITSVSPNVGGMLGGTKVTITGTGLSGATTVFFGSKNRKVQPGGTDTMIVAYSPAAVPGTVDLTVLTPVGTSAINANDKFITASRATVLSVTPASGPLAGGTKVDITGANLDGATAVMFGSVAATILRVANDGDRMFVRTPAGVKLGTVKVTVVTASHGTSAKKANDLFTYM